MILDDGWADGNGEDLMKINPDIDLQHIISYAGEHGVGIILWAGFDAFEKDMENVCRHYSRMGVKGFKVDFMNRDDQKRTEFNYRAAETAAKYHLVLDLHGSHKGAGINRTWPNVLNNEGVFGLENLKWGGTKTSMVHYDACLPFLRAVAGPMDYTQGAMRNATKSNFRPVNSEPMSQGTRCHQLALYLIFDSPLNMLCDSPTNYIAEQQCTDFICAVPTVWDDTRMLDGKIGEYVITARKSPESGMSEESPTGLHAASMSSWEEFSNRENTYCSFSATEPILTAVQATTSMRKFRLPFQETILPLPLKWLLVEALQ